MLIIISIESQVIRYIPRTSALIVICNDDLRNVIEICDSQCKHVERKTCVRSNALSTRNTKSQQLAMYD